jgi:hypothetical protein
MATAPNTLVRSAASNLKAGALADGEARQSGDPAKMLEAVLHYMEGSYWADAVLVAPEAADNIKLQIQQKKSQAMKRVDFWREQLANDEQVNTFRRPYFMPSPPTSPSI